MLNNKTVLKISKDGQTSVWQKCLQALILLAMMVSLFVLMLMSGINMGNDTISKTMFVSDADIVPTQTIMIDDSALAPAAAAGGTSTQSTFSNNNTNIAKTLSINVGGQSMSASTVSYVSYWAGNSSSTNYYAGGSGKFGVYGSGTVRQKRITMNAYVNFALGTNLQKLAAAGKLKVTVSGTYGTGNGYDQDIYAGAKFSATALNATENSGDSRLKGFTTNTVFRKSVGSNSFSVAVTAPTNAQFLILGVCGTTNYSGIGGRYPDVYMQSQTVTFTSTDTTAPTIELTENMYGTSIAWQSSRAVKYKVSDDVATATLVSAVLKNGSTTLLTTNAPTNGGTITTAPANAFASGLYIDATDRSGNVGKTISYNNSATSTGRTTATSVSALYLKIDTTAPTISSPKFVPTSSLSSSAISSPYSGAVTLLVTVADTHSGVGQVLVTNSTTGKSYTASLYSTTSNTATQPTAVSNGVYRVDLGNEANGAYTITARDNTRNSAGTLNDSTRNQSTSSTTFAYQDTASPTIKAPTLAYQARATKTANIWDTDYKLNSATSYTSGSSTFANNFITMTFVITDTTGSSYSTANSNYAKISAIKIFCLYNGTVLTLTPTLKSGPTFSNPTNTYTYECVLPYSTTNTSYTINTASGTVGSGASCTGYTIWTKDMAGNVAYTAGIAVKIDTISPEIEARTLSSSDALGETAGRGSTLYANKNIVLTVRCLDNASSSTASYPGPNNGSGIKAIYVYNALTHALVASNTTLSGTDVSVSFTLSSDSSSIYSYKIVVFDHAGNSSQWGNGNAASITNYYYNPTPVVNKTFGTLKDAVMPSIAFQYSLNNGATYVTHSINASQTFTFPWTKTASVKFKFIVTFGSSGGTFYDDSNNTNLGSKAQGVTVANNVYTANAGNIANNSLTIERTITADGVKSHRYKFTNGAKQTVYSPTVVTRIDTGKPSIELLGFGDYLSSSSSFTTNAQAKAAIKNGKTEAQLTNDSQWWSGPGSLPIYAIFAITDTAAGVGFETDTSSSIGGGVNSESKITVTFSHNGYSYTDILTRTGASGEAGAAERVTLNKYGSIYIVHVRFWNENDMAKAKKGSTLFRNPTTQDFDLASGSKLRYNMAVADFVGNETNAQRTGGSTDLEYCVDPFPTNVRVGSVVTVDSNNVSTAYDLVSWTRNKVVININKVNSLTDTFVSWGYVNITDDAGGAVNGAIGNDFSKISNWQSVPGDTATAKTATLELPAISFCAQIMIKINNKTGSTNYATGFGGGPIYVRQDTSSPILMSVAFSASASLSFEQMTSSNGNILLFYEYNKGTKTWTRKSSNQDANVWTTGAIQDNVYKNGVYMYVVATDTQGSAGQGTGSGIKSIAIKLGGAAYDTLTTASYSSDTANMYRTSASKLFGYLTATEVKSLEFTLLDNQGNQDIVSVTYDKDGKKIMPVIDNTRPFVSIKTATYGGVNYLQDGLLSGIPTKQNINIVFGVDSGVSGAKLYVRAINELGTPMATSSNPYFANSTKPGVVPFGLISSVANGVTGWTNIYTYTNANNNASVSYAINSTSIKQRFEVLLVTTTNAFYYFDCGDVFIDSTPPVIDASKTFYTRFSDTNNNLPTVNYDTITKVNDVVTGSKYTNDSIYAYFYVEDLASGLRQNGVYYDNSGQIVYLDKVSVKRTVGGVSVTTDYYRLTLDNRNTFRITAIDNSENIAQSATFTPNIDKTGVEILVEGETAEGTNYILGAGNVFTNSAKVVVKITVNYGASGFGGFSYSKDGGAWTPITADKLFNISWVKTPTANQHTVTVDFVDEQNSTYEFRAYNTIEANYAINSARPMGTNNIKIAIDKTAPTINLTKGNYNELTTVWHGTGKVLTISVSDGSAGSGINTIRLDYSVGGQAQTAIPLSASGELFSTGTRTLDYYTDYTITMTDKAGNIATQIIRPRIDSQNPTWGSYSGATANYKLLTVPNGDVYTANTWTEYDINALITMIYTMSGVRLQYYRSNTEVANVSTIGDASWINLTGATANWSVEIPSIADASKTETKADVGYLISILAEQNVSQYHYLRMVSGAGRTSTVLSLGFVKIDKETPNIAVESKINNNTNIWGTVNSSTHTTTFSQWTSSSLTMNIKSTSTLVSGYTVYYRLSTTASWIAVEYNYSGTAISYSYGTTNNVPDAKKMTFAHLVSDSTNKATYQYYIKSGSGRISPTYTVSEIKIDTAQPTLGVAGRTSNIYGTANGELLKTATASEYTAGLATYTIANPTWVNTNSVIIAITASSISYSGVILKINNIVYDTFDYGQGDITKYYVVSKSTQLSILLESRAGRQREVSGQVKIDNDIPVVYVASIDGTKASNFDAVANYADKWYTSKTTIKLVVGRYINNGDGTYTYQEDTTASTDDIPSGYTIYYSINGGDWISNDQVLSVTANNLDNGNFVDPINNTYRFKIVTGSNMEYVLGSDAVNNTGAVVKTKAQIRTLIESKNGLIKNLNDSDYLYTVNVDSRDFTIVGSHIMELTMANGNSYNWTVSASNNPVFSTDTIYKSSNGTANGVFTATNAVTFKRGDLIKIMYDTMIYQGTNRYLFRHANYGGNTVTNLDGGNTELEGQFSFSFVDSNFVYNSYFMIELAVEYANEALYLQSGQNANVTASASFIYKNLASANEILNLKFDYIYKDMQGNVVDKNNIGVGGYIVNAIISDNNINSFRLSNPNTVLLVKYFTETAPNSEATPYSIDNENDLSKVSSIYYDGYTENDGVFTLNAPKSYLNSHFKLSKSLDLSASFGGVSGTFMGTFSGDNHTLTMQGGAVNGSYGLFEKLSGKVSKLNIHLRQTLSLSNTVLVGILAREIVNGTVNGVYVSGDIVILDANLDARVGGLAGYIQNSNIGANNEVVYVDVSLTNNGNAISRAYIGGVAGYIGAGTKLNYTYAYGDITLYNVGVDTQIGMVFGKIDNYITVANRSDYFFNNYYLDKTVFKNGELVDSYSSDANVINDANQTNNTIRAKTYSNFVNTSTGSGDIGVVFVNDKLLRELVLIKLYKDMNLSYIYEVDGNSYYDFNSGEGTFDSHLVITNIDQFMMIDKYVNLYYDIAQDFDFSSYNQPIASYRIFYGTINGDGHTIFNFGSGVGAITTSTYGLLGKLDGVVKGFVFDNVDININYSETAELSVGLISGKMLEHAIVSDIIALGNTVINSTSQAVVNAGGVVGAIYGGSIYDVFVMNNLKVMGSIIRLGGVAGFASNAILATYDNEIGTAVDAPVFSLGRVESWASVSTVIGFVIGYGNIGGAIDKVFAINDNAYSSGNKVTRTIGSQSGNPGITVDDFTNPDSEMRKAIFSNGTNVFSTVFGSHDERLYPLAGLGMATDKFIIRSNVGDSSINDFRYINQALYASYNIEGDIVFAEGEFLTIGQGLVFTGSIDGKNADSDSAEEGSVSSLLNVTDALVYKNAGTITDLVVNITYNKVVTHNADTDYDHVFGAIAVYNEKFGVIRNVTVSGSINISATENNVSLVVSGFVGIDNGGTVDGENKLQNSISGLNININDISTVIAGGYIGIVNGQTILRYGIGSGTLSINNSQQMAVYAGTLIGIANTECDVSSVEEISEYQYIVLVNGDPRTDIVGVENY